MQTARTQVVAFHKRGVEEHRAGERRGGAHGGELERGPPELLPHRAQDPPAHRAERRVGGAELLNGNPDVSGGRPRHDRHAAADGEARVRRVWSAIRVFEPNGHDGGNSQQAQHGFQVAAADRKRYAGGRIEDAG